MPSAGVQSQLDDLAATVEAQQRQLEEQARQLGTLAATVQADHRNLQGVMLANARRGPAAGAGGR